MLVSAAALMRERGAAGVTIDAVLSRSGAPRGSVYHHFPGGRNQLLTEALRFAGDAIAGRVEHANGAGSQELVGEFVDFWEQVLTASDFAAGCPVVAAAIGSADDEPPQAELAGEIFRRWRDSLSRGFTADGFAPSEAESLANTCISAFEGAVVLCRATRSLTPLRDVAGQIEFLVKARDFVRRNER